MKKNSEWFFQTLPRHAPFSSVKKGDDVFVKTGKTIQNVSSKTVFALCQQRDFIEL
jgi:hypothetical protein